MIAPLPPCGVHGFADPPPPPPGRRGAMSLRDDILDLLRDRDIAPTRAMRAQLDELLALVASENPDLPPPGGVGDDEAPAADDDDAGLAVRTVPCPHCGEPVVVELELDGGGQEAIHDCSVCCRPIRFTWTVQDGRLDGFAAGPG